VFANFALGAIMTFGLVGLAMGLGATFANFTWEHPSQLAASFGSLIYMLGSTVLILICLMPGMMMLLLFKLNWLAGLTEIEKATVLFCNCYLLCYINLTITRWSILLGAKSLQGDTR
jgi:hypothetical protein